MILGPMVMARFGTCGIVEERIITGGVMIPPSAVYVRQNFDYDPSDKSEGSKPFFISKQALSDSRLQGLIAKKFEAVVGKDAIYNEGVMATAETFYSGQGIFWDRSLGRQLKNFTDHTANLFEILKEMYPKHESLEMEMYTL